MTKREQQHIKQHQKAIGARIRTIRGDRNQGEFAELLNSTQGYISDLERGRCFPSVSFLSRLAEISGRSYQWILTGRKSTDGAPKQRAKEPEKTLIVSAKEKPDLYRIITLFEEAEPSERSRFLKVALAFFGKRK